MQGSLLKDNNGICIKNIQKSSIDKLSEIHTSSYLSKDLFKCKPKHETKLI